VSRDPDPEHQRTIEQSSTTDGLPVAPSLGPGLETVGEPRQGGAVDARVIWLAVCASGLAVVAAVVAQILSRMIGLITNLAFYGKLSFAFVSPADHQLGGWVVLVPVAGALVVGVMARYGSAAIRGHGIPEAMEQVLFNQSRIPARMTLLKPLSAVIAIGTGGPFGAEGPIIATGGALGSLFGQLVRVTAEERKTLLAAGAAAGMAATFGSPVAAVLLSIELLLFEYRARSVIPVALASVTAAAVRLAFTGTAPAFVVKDLAPPGAPALLGYVAIGAIAGVLSVFVTKAVYAVEDAFARLPLHWMWWPALGAIPVGLVGIIAPRTLGVGYDNIEQMVSGTLTGRALFVLCAWKFVSWLFSLGSGTSGGTLAPLFTIGGGVGAACGAGIELIAPSLGVDARLGALVGMAAMFAGASRALLASVVFAFEATRQPFGLLPLLGGCSAAYLLSCTLMKHSIMTEKIARRGRPVPSEYAADYLEQLLVSDVALRPVVTVSAVQTLGSLRAWLRSDEPGADHHGFPVLGADQKLLGVITRRDASTSRLHADARLAELVTRSAVVIEPEASLREARDVMARERVGRLPVVQRGRLIGILTRGDLVGVHEHRLMRETERARARRLPFVRERPVSG
jgi:H+/Cl- antiporter ClcA/CBS domain-containing protein